MAAEWKFIRNWLRQGTASYNQEVLDYFRDVPADADPTINNRSAARRVCLIQPEDSGIVAMHKRMNFYFEVQQSHKKPEIYGIPSTTFQEYFKFKPQIKLCFAEDWQDVEPGYSPVEGQISFRVMGVEPGTITQSQVNDWAQKIKSEFATNGGYVWKKGKEQFVYREEDKGYQFRVLARTENDAKSLIEKTLSIENNTPDWSYLNKSENSSPAEAYPTNPGSVTILGETTRKIRKRPIADVRFLFANLFLYGRRKPIVLVDRVNYFSEAIEVVR